MAQLKPFSPAKYLLWTLLQFALLLMVMQIILQQFGLQFLSTQLSFGWKKFLVVFIGLSFWLGLFEWLFHRYVLHAVILRPLHGLAREHRAHHGLTPRQKYPIVEPEQYDNQSFPWYALPTFWGIFSVLLWPLHWLFPAWPWLLAGYAAVTCSLTLYELLHSCEHKPLIWWELYVGFFFGQQWKVLYNFHHMHHYRLWVNESISGFFGLPVWDWIFGTYYVSEGLLPDGEIDRNVNKPLPRPRALIRWLDALAVRQEQALRAKGLISD